MPAIVPFRSLSIMKRGMRLNPYYRRAVAARRIFNFVYKHRRPIGRGIKRMSTWRYGVFKKRKLSHIGKPVGQSTTKRREQSNQGLAAIDSRVLYLVNLTEIGRTNSNSINQRQRDIIQVTGIRVRLQMLGLGSGAKYFNVAMIFKKRGGDVPNATDFFRGYDDLRSLDFNTNLSAQEFHSNPINTDVYTVIMHKRFIIGPADQTAYLNNKTGASYRDFDKFVKIKRQLQFGNNNAESSEGRIYLVYWCDLWNAPPGAISSPSVMQVSDYHTMYFREPR